jgi:heat shock protein HslJ
MKRHPIFLAFVFALAACSTAPGDTERRNADARVATSSDIALSAYHWDLVAAKDQQGQAIAALQPPGDKPLRLDFADGRIGISGGCNRIGGSYRQTDASLQFGPLTQTEMACADRRLMDLDAAIAQRLAGTVQARIRSGESPQLQLVAGNGDHLDFSGTPTPRTRYGGAGTTVFLEIAPQRIPCSHPLIPNLQCLQVRERTYAQNGTIATQGEWQPLYQEIEGYTHAPGVRNVLRLKKFEVKNPPADASSVAYVLDLIVESELKTD